MTDVAGLAGMIAPTSIAIPIRWATVISVTPATARAVVRPSHATATDGSQDITTAYLSPVAPGVGAVVRLDTYQGDVLIVGSPTLDAYPASPFAMSAGRVSVSLAAATQGTALVTFPAGRFLFAPVVAFGFDDPGSSTVSEVRMAATVTTTGFTCVVNAASAVTATYNVGWIAVQMTSLSAAG